MRTLGSSARVESHGVDWAMDKKKTHIDGESMAWSGMNIGSRHDGTKVYTLELRY